MSTKEIQIPRVSFTFDRRKVAAKGKPAAVEIEVYYNRKRLWFSTGVMLYPSQWKRDKVVNHEKQDDLNKKLQVQYEYIESCIADMYSEGEIQLEQLKGISFVSDEAESALCTAELVISPGNPFEWMESVVKDLAGIEPTTLYKHSHSIKVIKESGIFNSFEDFTPGNILSLDSYLHNTIKYHGKPLSQVTIFRYHKELKFFLRRALQKGYIKHNPYKPIRLPHGNSEVIRYLTDEERARIESLELSGMIDAVRDMFLFSCYTGLAYSDMIKIKKSDIEEKNGRYYVSDLRKKTKSRYKITILPKAMKILEKHDFNLNFISNQKSNINLKKIASLAGINKRLTMHMGRHTFATCALNHGVPIATVSKMLAHGSIKTTQIYAIVLQENVNNGYDQLKDL